MYSALNNLRGALGQGPVDVVELESTSEDEEEYDDDDEEEEEEDDEKERSETNKLAT